MIRGIRNMKMRLIMASLLLLLPVQAWPADLGNMRISLIEGDAQVKMAESDEWVPLAINTPLRDGDRLWVPQDGRLEINLRNGTFVRLDEYSSLEILTTDKESFQFYMNAGHAYVNFRGGRDAMLQFDTPLSSVRTYEKAKFMIDVAGDSRTEISVLKGLVYAESRSGRTRIASGKVLDISSDGYADLFTLGSADAWERWNRDRDSRFEDRSYSSSRYLPDELESYAYDFEDNGRWVYAKEYGYVWTPTVFVSAGWSPYRHGRWIWVGSDYVWISYEPWGWAPYHYGRWAHVGSIGWCWVPPARGGVYWGPGYVGWVHTPTYVAWVPLAPGDIYYGYGYYGPHSVNIININIRKTVIKHDYRNARMRDAVVIHHNETFRTGKPVSFRPKDNPFLGEKATFGRPTLPVGKDLTMPIVKEISQTHKPPREIREVRVHELKQERPLVREKHMTVISRDSVQQSMQIRDVQETRQRQARPSAGISGEQGQVRAGETMRPGEERRMEGTGEQKDSRMKAPSFEGRGREYAPAARVHEPQESSVGRPAERMKTPTERRVAAPVDREVSSPPSYEPSREEQRQPENAPPQTPRMFQGSQRKSSPERQPETRERQPMPRWPSALPESQSVTRPPATPERRETSAGPAPQRPAPPASVSPAAPMRTERQQKSVSVPKAPEFQGSQGMQRTPGSFGQGRER